MAMAFLLGLSGCLHLGLFGITRHRQSEMAVCCSDNDTSDGIGAFLHGHISGGNVAHCYLWHLARVGHLARLYSMQHLPEPASLLTFDTRPTLQVQAYKAPRGLRGLVRP